MGYSSGERFPNIFYAKHFSCFLWEYYTAQKKETFIKLFHNSNCVEKLYKIEYLIECPFGSKNTYLNGSSREQILWRSSCFRIESVQFDMELTHWT